MGAPAGPQYIQIIDTTGPLVGATIEYTDLSGPESGLETGP
jgi:hypothetical protein